MKLKFKVLTCSTEIDPLFLKEPFFYVIVRDNVQVGHALQTRKEAELVCKWMNSVNYGIDLLPSSIKKLNK